MNAFCSSIRPSAGWASRLGLLAVAAGLTAVQPCAAAAASWHADVAAAQAAAGASGKPVFVLFAAAWDDHAAAALLSNSEVDAVISACFEPVRIDVDTQPELIRELGVERVPSVAVLGGSREVLTTFECPATAAEFVAATARAAQVAAATTAPRAGAESASVQEPSPFRDPSAGLEPVAASVTEKVRQLSSFAEGKPMPLRDPSRFPVVASGPAARDVESAPVISAPDQEPVLARTPPAWPAERPTGSGFGEAPVAQASASASAPSIEPSPAPTAPWLAGAATATDGQAAATAEGPAEAKPESSSFLATLQRPFTAISRWSAKPTAEQPPKMPPALPQSPAAVAASGADTTSAPAPVTDTHGSMPLGLEGYCPVTVAERGAWIEGRAQWGVRHRGRTYLFAGPEQQKAFLADPDRFAPALSGDDPVLAFESGRSEPGRRTFGVTYQSRMYLFASPETRAAFAADPSRYTARVQNAEGLAPADAPRRF